MELPDEIAATRAGTGDPAALVGEFRRTAVLVPTVSPAGGAGPLGAGPPDEGPPDEGPPDEERLDGDRLMSAGYGGVRWIFAFTDEAALARFAEERAGAREGAPGRHGEPAAGEPWTYVSVLGARLLDAVIPALGGPAGVAVNAADGDGSMLFPPVRGIVPDEVAVDAGTEEEGV
ncbi:hypothetical protein MMF93_19735 [Streptomyces tubbatahanensis]|uniref:SseB protein N-terminal domain-containing protein n=1 Tax=Streptomyces tubbatahanensis TaxID=2923272 RepID=A0ABY3XVM3_9ACTN|nr:hypothetical protein [Streptomyces tubbatahanensis]UNS98432.1 hypothetical protein MMF93_19735 [Streptomyces tubbatahanensis]